MSHINFIDSTITITPVIATALLLDDWEQLCDEHLQLNILTKPHTAPKDSEIPTKLDCGTLPQNSSTTDLVLERPSIARAINKHATVHAEISTTVEIITDSVVDLVTTTEKTLTDDEKNVISEVLTPIDTRTTISSTKIPLITDAGSTQLDFMSEEKTDSLSWIPVNSHKKSRRPALQNADTNVTKPGSKLTEKIQVESMDCGSQHAKRLTGRMGRTISAIRELSYDCKIHVDFDRGVVEFMGTSQQVQIARLLSSVVMASGLHGLEDLELVIAQRQQSALSESAFESLLQKLKQRSHNKEASKVPILHQPHHDMNEPRVTSVPVAIVDVEASNCSGIAAVFPVAELVPAVPCNSWAALASASIGTAVAMAKQTSPVPQTAIAATKRVRGVKEIASCRQGSNPHTSARPNAASSIDCPRHLVARLIGTAGATIKAIRSLSKCNVEVFHKRGNDMTAPVTLQGTVDEVACGRLLVLTVMAHGHRGTQERGLVAATAATLQYGEIKEASLQALLNQLVDVEPWRPTIGVNAQPFVQLQAAAIPEAAMIVADPESFPALQPSDTRPCEHSRAATIQTPKDRIKEQETKNQRPAAQPLQQPRALLQPRYGSQPRPQLPSRPQWQVYTAQYASEIIRRIIGRQASTIKSIRDRCGGCHIQVDNNESPEPMRTVTFKGPVEQVGLARLLVETVVRHGYKGTTSHRTMRSVWSDMPLDDTLSEERLTTFLQTFVDEPMASVVITVSTGEVLDAIFEKATAEEKEKEHKQLLAAAARQLAQEAKAIELIAQQQRDRDAEERRALAAQQAQTVFATSRTLADTVVATGLKGSELLVHVNSLDVQPTGAALLSSVLMSCGSSAEACLGKWVAEAEYGPALTHLLQRSERDQVNAVFSIQAYCYSLGFPLVEVQGRPKAVIVMLFERLFCSGLVDAAAFLGWAEEEGEGGGESAGRTTAVIQTTSFVQKMREVLESDSEEEDEGEEEVDAPRAFLR